VRIAAEAVVGTVRRDQSDGAWRSHDVCRLLGVNAARLREIARRVGLACGSTWTADEVHRVLARQLAEGMPAERERAAEALSAMQCVDGGAVDKASRRRPQPY
jgi:hypothetical protein